MSGFCRYSAIVILLLASTIAQAQQHMPFGLVPVQKPINITILGSDTSVLKCYNLYGYSYVSGTDTVTGEFIVLKQADTFSAKQDATITFCRIREFAMYNGAGCTSLTVDGGIEIAYPGQKEKVFLNFDPAMPDAVFMPCK